MTKQADLKRRVRDRMARTGESYSAARRQLLAGAPGTPVADRMAAALHVSNGDATDLPGTGLAPRVLYWRDVLHEGPVPAVGPQQLRRARVPLLHAASSDRPVRRGTALRLTDTGARVLAGDADHVTLNGIDRWIGGVHLRGPDAGWRWDDGTETLVRTAEGSR